MKTDLDTQGHRGFRGKYPENTIHGFLKAIDTGVKTLEMDVVVTKDNYLVVSHEPYISNEICTNMGENYIIDYSKENYNIYNMYYSQVQTFDCGSKIHPGFPEQEKVIATKPSLEEVIDAAEAYAEKNYDKQMYYNIEIKSTPAGDSIFHPAPKEFAELLVMKIKELGVENRTYIQSFDKRALQAVNQLDEKIKTVLLVENAKGYNSNLKELGFKPDVYSPEHRLVTKRMVEDLHDREIRVIPWTVNDTSDMKQLINLGVDGLISDYPDRLMKIVNDQKK
ncbi:glycerophosphodiester phosphodiesterase [Mangrovivirga sp. M17]|uniref:Glycerophosphodiester phosphodiesterase n=1 Tax=Mangrovivirga halotolerans TaxID=2993936 RepID=A0ABT3RRS0_9BACT|nr:glycerophosphodiester phosphodiesterase [Mangrovivirga halotolerans]MCX2744069.1 glycerophosphodiester phosphodiesterase [Mangrovivirga halotolerans]